MHESAKLSHVGRHESAYSGPPSQRQVQLMGQVVYPTWAALSISGEGSRHGRAGRGEGPKQAGQVFQCGFGCHVGIRTSIPMSLMGSGGKPMRWAKVGLPPWKLCPENFEGSTLILRRQYHRVLTNNQCVRGVIPPPSRAGTANAGPAGSACGRP
jgi:hypothetical protein